jgi:hypothetical protein
MTIASQQLWETFSGPLHQFIQRRVPDPHSAEDILQDVAKVKEQLLSCCQFQFDHAGRIIDYQPPSSGDCEAVG